MTQDEIHIMALKGLYITLGETQLEVRNLKVENEQLQAQTQEGSNKVLELEMQLAKRYCEVPMDQFEFVQAWLAKLGPEFSDVNASFTALNENYTLFCSQDNSDISHLQAVNDFIEKVSH